MSERRPRIRKEVLDVAALPSYQFGPRTIMWWTTAGLIAIEATLFALAAFTYFYVRTKVDVWPPALPPPNLLWGTLNLLIMLGSLVPNTMSRKNAEKQDLPALRQSMRFDLAFGFTFIVVRVLEFTALNVRWDSNAYGSAVWVLLGLHTVHLVTDVADTLGQYILLGTDRVEGKRFVDASENAFYWYFVVVAWVPIYAIIYLAPRMM